MEKIYSALLVEDDENWILYFQETIEKSNRNCFKFDYAKTVKEARTYLTNKTYELVLLDLILSDCQGENTILALKEEIKDLPVIIVTALADDYIRNFCFKNGVDDYLIKGEYNESIFFHATQTVVDKAIIRSDTLTKISANLDLLKNTLTQILDSTA